MKRRPARFVALLVAFCLLTRRSNAQPADTALAAFADSLMNAQLAREHIPGAVLVVVRDGAVAFARGYGLADVERRVPVDAERTVFRVASVSKLVTATAAMQLVEQGRIGLHADVNRYLRRFQIPAAFGRPVTLFDLLTHTAGFDESNIARKAHRAADVGPLGDYLARRLPARIRPPGEKIAYSNHGMALAGYLVEAVSGMPFARYVRERVLTPLGMLHSSFELVPDSAALTATGYEGSPPRRQAPDYTRTLPASMLCASGNDIARFMIAHLEGGQLDGHRLLGDSSVVAMHQRQFTQHPMLAGIGLAFWERFQNGEHALWHDGDASGFASLLYLLPERHTGYFLAFNSRNGARARREILASLLDREFPRAHERVPPSTDANDVVPGSRLPGTYVDIRYGHRTMEKLAALARYTTVAPGTGRSLMFSGARYQPMGPREFQSEDGEGRLAFELDRGGRVTYLFASRSIASVYERVPWYGTVPTQIAWLGSCVLTFLVHLLSALFRALFRRSRPGAAADARPAQRWLGRALVFVAIADLVFVVGLAACLSGAFGSLEYGIPTALVLLLGIPVLTTAVTLALLPESLRSWSRGARPWARTLALAAALAFIPWLAYWNLLGWRF